MRIRFIDWDDDNLEHATKRVSATEIDAVFFSRPEIRRNKRSGSADYYAIANGVCVNFVYDNGAARPISAWRGGAMTPDGMTGAELAEWQYEHQEELDAEVGELVEVEIDENLTVMISFRATKAEADRIRGHAAGADLTVSDWIRHCCAAARDRPAPIDSDVPRDHATVARSETLTVRLGRAEAASYRSEAAGVGQSLSEWIREACEVYGARQETAVGLLMNEATLFGFRQSVGIELSLPAGTGQALVGSTGSLALRIDGRTVWENVPFSPVGLLRHLARSWRALIWHDGPPFELSPAPARELRRQAAERAQYEPVQLGRETVAAIERFLDQHDLARGLDEGSDVGPVVVVREGRYFWLSSDDVNERFSERVVVDALESVGDFLAERLSDTADGTSQSVREGWRNRLVVDAVERVSIATSLTTEEVRRLSGSTPVEEAWDLDSTDANELNELLAVARTASPLGEGSLRELLDAVRRQSSSDTKRLDEISFKAQFVLATHSDKRAFEQGLLLAQWLRHEWTESRSEALGRLNPDDVLADCGVQVDELSGDLPQVFDAVSCWGPRRGPFVLINANGQHNQSEGGRRATLAHELCHVLVDRPGALPFGEVLGMGRHGRAEARANAFAAEFLIPQSVAGKLMSQTTEDPAAAVERLRIRYGASSEVIAWQSRNAGVALPESVYTHLRGLVSQPDRF